MFPVAHPAPPTPKGGKAEDRFALRANVREKVSPSVDQLGSSAPRLSRATTAGCQVPREARPATISWSTAATSAAGTAEAADGTPAALTANRDRRSYYEPTCSSAPRFPRTMTRGD